MVAIKVKFDKEQHLTFHFHISIYLLCNLNNVYRTEQLLYNVHLKLCLSYFILTYMLFLQYMS